MLRADLEVPLVLRLTYIGTRSTYLVKPTELLSSNAFVSYLSNSLLV